MTLAEFMAARLTATGILADSAGVDDDAWTVRPGDPDEVAHAVMWQPARVLALVEAGRAILELHRPITLAESSTGYCTECDHYDLNDDPCPTLRAFALVWADHPDYRDEWRPT